MCSNKDPADIWSCRSALDIQTFSLYDLSPPFFLHINARTVSSLHPVALLTVPKLLSSPDGDALIANIPIARVSNRSICCRFAY